MARAYRTIVADVLRALLDWSFDHPETVENLGVVPVETPEVDSEQFAKHLGEQFDLGEQRAAREAE